MSNELLSPAEMSEADRLTIAAGPADGIGLMRRAGGAVAAEVLKRYPSAKHIHVLCGPGNNGGDGYVVARILAGSGVGTSVWASGAPRPKSDAALAAAECPIKPRPLSDFDAKPGSIVIDALYGAGLSKPLSGDAAKAIDTVTALSLPVVAVDLPSGVSGRSGDILGRAFRAEVTITFARKKPGHLLLPGRGQCGEIVLADIGIGDGIIAQLAVSTFENVPDLWLQEFPVPTVDAHKYKRGHVGVFSGGPSATGAARLSALAAARSGAGAVTVLSPGNAMQVNAIHLTSIMLREAGSLEEVQEFLTVRHPGALVFGPGLGPKPKVGDFALQLIKALEEEARDEATANHASAMVLDADAITSLAHQPQALFEAARQPNAPALIVTPHEGEFGRLFPDIAG
ncbi:NAD(P)H-hydrate epimerase, partial [Mesorhizobium sp. M7A.F.Ca.CA.002.15.2.1]